MTSSVLRNRCSSTQPNEYSPLRRQENVDGKEIVPVRPSYQRVTHIERKRPRERPTDRAIERSSERSSKQSSDGASDRAIERSSERSSDQVSDRPIERSKRDGRNSSSRSPLDTLTSALRRIFAELVFLSHSRCLSTLKIESNMTSDKTSGARHNMFEVFKTLK